MGYERHSTLVVDGSAFWRPGATPQCAPDACALAMETDGRALRCSVCQERVPITEDIVELVDVDRLDAHKAGELAGNEIRLDEETIGRYLGKEHWNAFTRHFVHKKIGRLARWLAEEGIDRAAFLASGTGFEIGPLLRHGFRPRSLMLSDLTRSTLQVAAYGLATHGLDPTVPVSLFTSDLDAVPLKDRDLPLVVYEGLHHTADMHAALESMLAFGYRTIFFVEPCDNLVIRALASRGLARRIEYSGLSPDRLDLGRLRALCKQYGYRCDVETMWELPGDYFTRLVRGRPRPWNVRLFAAAVDALTTLGKPIGLGNFAICRLKRSAHASILSGSARPRARADPR
jgi:hypothetical protein